MRTLLVVGLAAFAGCGGGEYPDWSFKECEVESVTTKPAKVKTDDGKTVWLSYAYSRCKR